MKKLIAFILSIGLIMSLIACSREEPVELPEQNATTARFQFVAEDTSDMLTPTGLWIFHTSIIVDTYTGVMYLCHNGSRGAFGITALLNTDGTPMIWEGEK